MVNGTLFRTPKALWKSGLAAVQNLQKHSAPDIGKGTIRERTAETMVRFLGGDETLIAEIRTNRIAQEHLAATNPEHPARLFGEAVEIDSLPSSEEQQNSRRLQSDADGHNVRVARLHAIKAAKEVADHGGGLQLRPT